MSFVFIAILTLVALFFWYSPHLWRYGAEQGLKIVVLVDLVLGPVLTFIVFKKGKQKLLFDLSVIFAIQIACLLYGANLIVNERPVIQLIGEEGVILLTQKQVNDIDKSKDIDFTTHNQLFFVTLSDDIGQIVTSKTVKELTTGIPYSYQPDKMKNLEQVSEVQFENRMSLIYKFIEDYQLTRIQKLSKENSQACKIVPIKAQHAGNSFACISKKEGIVYTVKL